MSSDSYLVFSYSKFAVEHYKQLAKKYINYRVFVNEKNIKTIDAYCYNLIEKITGSIYITELLTQKIYDIIENERDNNNELLIKLKNYMKKPS